MAEEEPGQDPKLPPDARLDRLEQRLERAQREEALRTGEGTKADANEQLGNRALIQTAKGFKDPTTVIAPVVPFPLDAPGIAVETRTLSKEEQQTQTSPPEGEIKVSTPTPTGSER